MSYAIRQRLQQIRDRVNRCSPWPWRREGSTVVAPLDWDFYGGDLVAESVEGRNADLIERAPEDIAFLCALVSALLDDRHRLDFLLDEQWVCRTRDEVDRLMAGRDGEQRRRLSIVPADYEIVDETTAGAA